MLLKTLRNASFFLSLLQIDNDLALEVWKSCCPFCGGVLHTADYPRNPRGIPPDPLLDENYRRRHSFCCAKCRKRATPPSVRFLGRRVYLSAVFVLISAMRLGITSKRAARLGEHLGIALSTRTLLRWRKWWLETFSDTPLWKRQRGRLDRPVAVPGIPRSLLRRFDADDLNERLTLFLRFLAPLTTTSWAMDP